jgi:hypothetical protein
MTLRKTPLLQSPAHKFGRLQFSLVVMLCEVVVVLNTLLSIFYRSEWHINILFLPAIVLIVLASAWQWSSLLGRLLQIACLGSGLALFALASVLLANSAWHNPWLLLILFGLGFVASAWLLKFSALGRN